MIQRRFLQQSVRRDSRFRLQRYIFFLNCPNHGCPFLFIPVQKPFRNHGVFALFRSFPFTLVQRFSGRTSWHP